MRNTNVNYLWLNLQFEYNTRCSIVHLDVPNVSERFLLLVVRFYLNIIDISISELFLLFQVTSYDP